MYFITAILTKNIDGILIGTETRCFGFFNKLEKAIDVVVTNAYDMHENYYSYLIIERIEESIHPTVIEMVWYEWNENKKRWQQISKPDFSIGICNWALG